MRRIFSWMKEAGRVLISPDTRRGALHECRRRHQGEPPLPSREIATVLVVCDGNICRSPFAAALLAVRCPELRVRSAGFSAGEGAPAEEAARRAARDFGIDLASHAAHRLLPEDLVNADLILGMEGHHAAHIASRGPDVGSRTRLLGDYLSHPPYHIGDPWGESDDVFSATFARIATAIARLSQLLSS